MSIVYGGIVFAIATVFIVQFRPGSGQETASWTQQCAVVVRDRCIEPKEFQAALGLVAPRGVDESALRDMGIRREVAEGLVERTLLVQDAKRLDLTVSDEEINAELVRGRFRVSLPYSKKNIGMYLRLTDEGVRLLDVTDEKTKKFDYDVYTRVVRMTTNRSPSEFKEMQRDEIIADRMRKLIASRASVTDAEAFEAYGREKSSAKLEVVRLTKDYFAKKYVDTSPKAVEGWAKEHQKDVDESWTARKASFPAGCVKVRHILFKVQSTTDPGGHPREEAQGLIEKARGRIQRGEAFAVVAADMSEDAPTSTKGGNLGCVKKGALPEQLETVIFAQKNPGLVDAVVETAAGFHIVDVEAIVSDDEKKAEQQGRNLVAKDLMLAMETEKVIAETAKRIQETAQKGKPLAEAIDIVLAELDEQHGLTKKEDAKEDAKEGGKDTKEGKDAEGKDAEGKDAEEAPPDEPGRPAVETTASFTSVSGTPFDGVAPGQNVVEMAFKMAKPGDVASDLVRLENGYAVIRLKERNIADREQFEKERDEYIERMVYVKAEDLVVAYIARLRAAASDAITINEKYAQEPKRRTSEEE